MIAIVSIKWGKAFPSEYVNVLFRGVRRNISRPFTFYCLTDQPQGLDTGIVALPIPETGVEGIYQRPGCWPKVGVFQRGLFPGHRHGLFLDLDLVIRGSLDPFIARIEEQGGLHIIREWNPTIWSLLPLSMRPDRGAQSSVFAWTLADYHDLFDRFVADPERFYALYKNDQEFIGGEATPQAYWPYEWTASFRRHCVPHYPLNLLDPTIREPKDAPIVVFHGNPRPADLIGEGDYRWGTSRRYGHGAVPWVKRYWFDRS